MIRIFLAVTLSLAFIVGPLNGASDTSCVWQNGYCTTEPRCWDGYYYQYGLCSGAKRCCVPRGTGGDSACTNRKGHCIPKSTNICRGRMAYYQSGLCSGPADNQCCLLQYKD